MFYFIILGFYSCILSTWALIELNNWWHCKSSENQRQTACIQHACDCLWSQLAMHGFYTVEQCYFVISFLMRENWVHWEGPDTFKIVSGGFTCLITLTVV